MHHNNHMRSKITINCPTSRIDTLHNNHTLKEGVVGFSEAEEEEEDLIEEEFRLHAINVDN